jgi:hypothetical protein
MHYVSWYRKCFIIKELGDLYTHFYARSRKQEVCAEFGNGNPLQSDHWDASTQLHPDPTAAASNCAIREYHGMGGDGCAQSDTLSVRYGTTCRRVDVRRAMTSEPERRPHTVRSLSNVGRIKSLPPNNTTRPPDLQYGRSKLA